MGDELPGLLILDQGGEGESGRQKFSADGQHVDEGGGDKDDSQRGDGKHTEVVDALFFGDAYSNQIGGCSNDGHGATNDGGVGERDEKFGGDEVFFAANGEHDGHEDHHYWGVVDEAGKHGDDGHHDHQHAHGGVTGDFFEPIAQCLNDPSSLQARAEDKHAGDRDRGGMGKNLECVVRILWVHTEDACDHASKKRGEGSELNRYPFPREGNENKHHQNGEECLLPCFKDPHYRYTRIPMAVFTRKLYGSFSAETLTNPENDACLGGVIG